MEEKKRTIITQILQQSLHRFQSACLPEGTGPPVSVCWNVWRDEHMTVNVHYSPIHTQIKTQGTSRLGYTQCVSANTTGYSAVVQ